MGRAERKDSHGESEGGSSGERRDSTSGERRADAEAMEPGFWERREGAAQGD